MRVLVFHPWIKSKGGAEKLVLEYAKRTKNDVTILTWTYIPEKTFEEFRELDVISIYPKNFEEVSRAFLIRGAFYGLLAARRKLPIDWEDYDILLISTSGIAELIVLYNDITIPKVLYVHTPLRATFIYDIWFGFKYRYVSKIRGALAKEYYKAGIFIYNRLEEEAWKRIDYAIFNSELSRWRAIRKGLIPNCLSLKRTTILYPGVDIEHIRNEGYDNYFLYVARYGVSKRQVWLLKAWKEFVKKYPQYRLRLVGGFENKKYLMAVLKLAKRTPNVEVRVQVPYKYVLKSYANALCCIQVPYMEDFNIALIESIAAGKFVIATYPCGAYELVGSAPGVKWIKEKYKEELMVKEIYNALVDFVEHQDEYIKLGKKNREYIEKLGLSWDAFVTNMDSILKKLLFNI